MRQINQKATTDAIVANIEQAAPSLGRLELWNFAEGLRNRRYQNNPVEGLEMCLADEALPAIVRAHKGLKEKVSALTFAKAIAAEIDEFAKTFGSDPLTYPHFLLHGIKQDTLPAVVAKIKDNVRIIGETQAEREGLLIKARVPVPGVGNITFHNGQGDDFHGIVMRLNSKNSSSEAKVGFFLDRKNGCAYIANLQRRKLYERDMSGLNNRQRKEVQSAAHREYQDMCKHLEGKDPREFIIDQLKTILKSEGFTELKAIKPQEHLMSLANHPGFAGNYDTFLKSIGFIETSDCYLTFSL